MDGPPPDRGPGPAETALAPLPAQEQFRRVPQAVLPTNLLVATQEQIAGQYLPG